MKTPNSRHANNSFVYTNGQFAGEILELKSYAHSGGWLGTYTYYIRFPDEKFSLALMCNDAGLKTRHIKDDILKLYLNSK
jgi:hypothetical protein